MTIRGTTALVAHIGFPTDGFVSPLIYNPYFEQAGIDAAVVPMGCRADDFPAFLRAVFTLTNVRGALITMPHKVTAAALVDEPSEAVRLAGSCNAVRRGPDGWLQGDLFDGEGFVRALESKGWQVEGRRALVIGAGGVGSAIAASLAWAGAASIALTDTQPSAVHGVAERLARHFPSLDLRTDDADPRDRDIVVNATPMGMRPEDPSPVQVDRLSPDAFVGCVITAPAVSPWVAAARARGCKGSVGIDMYQAEQGLMTAFFLEALA